MKNLLVFLFLSFHIFPASAQQSTITTFILVRHAEKENDGTKDPTLSLEGVERANRLATILKKTAIDAIYSTNYKRTQGTVKPLATSKGLAIQDYEALKLEGIESMLAKHKGGTIVISGHSNNIPFIANYLIGKEELKTFDETDYSNFLIVSVVEKGKVSKITWLSY